MPDILLAELLSSVARAEEQMLERVARHEEATTDITFPPITVFLPGLVVSGQVATYRTYRDHMRRAIEEFEGTEEEIELGRVFFGPYYEALENLPERVEAEVLQRTQLFLVNVAAWAGTRPVELLPLSVPLEAVQGWTLGKMS